MTATRITAEAELNNLRSKVAHCEKHAARLRERSTPPSVEAIGERLLTAPQRVPAGDDKPIPPEVTAESARALHAIITGTPDSSTTARGEQYLATWLTTEDIETRWDADNPAYRWIHMLFGAPNADLLRRPADQAADAFAMSTAPGVPAIIATCRLGEPWVMHSAWELRAAISAISEETHCDLRLSDGTEFGSCIDRHARQLELIERFDGTDERGEWGKLRREYLAKEFVTVPFARGDLVILARFCRWCLASFQGLNRIDSRTCQFDEPYTDGFAPSPFNAIPDLPDEVIYESDIECNDDDLDL
jgi:hypothetical protein